jgi:hypothetical protein
MYGGVFLEPGIDSQKVQEVIFQETDMAPEIYDNRTRITGMSKIV